MSTSTVTNKKTNIDSVTMIFLYLSTSSSIDSYFDDFDYCGNGDGAFLFFQVGDGIDDFWLADKLLDSAEYVHMWI